MRDVLPGKGPHLTRLKQIWCLTLLSCMFWPSGLAYKAQKGEVLASSHERRILAVRIVVERNISTPWTGEEVNFQHNT